MRFVQFLFFRHALVYKTACEVSKMDVCKLCFCENKMLKNTRYTQLAIVTTSLAIFSSIFKFGIKPDVVAGMSLGEYSALAASGAISLEDILKLVIRRGEIMSESYKGETAMYAIKSPKIHEIERLCIEEMGNVSVANYNSPYQVVISGEKQAVNNVVQEVENKKIGKSILLNVSSAFHCNLMEPSCEYLRQELEQIQFSKLRVPIVSNTTGECICDEKKLAPLLVRHLVSPVRWSTGIINMIETGVNYFIEIGPGNTLAGLMKDFEDDIKISSVNSYKDMLRLLAELENSGGQE